MSPATSAKWKIPHEVQEVLDEMHHGLSHTDAEGVAVSIRITVTRGSVATVLGVEANLERDES